MALLLTGRAVDRRDTGEHGELRFVPETFDAGGLADQLGGDQHAAADELEQLRRIVGYQHGEFALKRVGLGCELTAPPHQVPELCGLPQPAPIGQDAGPAARPSDPGRPPYSKFWVRGVEQPAKALGPGELVTAVRLPQAGAGAGIAHEKMSMHERPAVTVTCLAHVADGQVSSARVAVGSVGNRPQRALEAEAALVGCAASEIGPQVSAAAEAAAEAANPVEDANGSVEYKRQLVRVLVARCAQAAVERAGSA
jgi:CO dehydrogenase flavoprotein C-terminal domain